MEQLKNRTFTLRAVSLEIRTELVRKTIHIMIALVPPLASISTAFTISLLAAGILTYAIAENMRHSGKDVFVISRLTNAASRVRDTGFVMGPVTLGIGAMLALMLYPAPAAAIAIYSLAFGDSAASLVGKLFGRIKIPFTDEKTVAGSVACFFIVYLVSFRITGSVSASLILGFSATMLEALSANDLDNIVLPVGTGFIASQILPSLI